jgi:hypothetical protein
VLAPTAIVVDRLAGYEMEVLVAGFAPGRVAISYKVLVVTLNSLKPTISAVALDLASHAVMPGIDVPLTTKDGDIMKALSLLPITSGRA